MEDNRMNKEELYFKWYQQLFADDESGDSDGAQGGEQDDGQGDDKGAEKTFTQAELDKILSDRLAREKAKLEKDAKDAAAAQLAKAQKEAEKKAKMDAEERAKYEKEQLEARIQELEAAQTRAALGRTVTTLLAENEIPVNDNLLDMLIGIDEESTNARVEVFVKAVQAEVDRKEKSRAKGTTPKTGNKPKDVDPLEAELKKRMEKYSKH